jgi:hypothetical protein
MLYIIIVVMLVTISCTKPYAPPPIKAVTGYLVVEGVINAGKGGGAYIPVNTIVEIGQIAGHTGAEAICVDCTLQAIFHEKDD